jgi:hypothetical protein
MTMNLTDALSPRAMFEFLARFLCSGTMYEYKLIAIYMKKIEVECEAGCEDKTTHHSLLVLLDYVEACNKEDKDRVVAEAAAQFESWKLEVARTISMARSERFELPTLGIEIRCSIQLSYERVSLFNAWAGSSNA